MNLAAEGAGTAEPAPPPPPPPLVVVVENHVVVASSLASVLRSWGSDAHVLPIGEGQQGIVERARQLLEVWLARGAVGRAVALVDLNLTSTLDGADVVGFLKEIGYRVAVLTGVVDPVRLGEAAERGADALVDKAAPMDELAEVIDRLRDGRRVLDDGERERLVGRVVSERARREPLLALLDRLTAAEASVLEGLEHGLSVQEIADRHVVSEATVRSQVRAILVKLGVHSQREAFRLATDAGWSAALWARRREAARRVR